MYGHRGRNDDAAGLDTVDSALESLQFSYLDGIPFVLDPRLSSTLSAIEGHLAKAKQLLDTRPAQSDLQIPDLAQFGKLETQVLEQLERMETDRREREERREAEIKQYQIEKEERVKAEEEAKLKAKEEEEEKKAAQEDADRKSGEEAAQLDSSTEDVSAASTQPARTPTDLHTTALQHQSNFDRPNGEALTTMPTPPPAMDKNLPAATAGANINFSEFESETDPFSRAELDTINTLQELAAVLQTSSTGSSMAGNNPAVSAVTAPSHRHNMPSSAAVTTYTTASNHYPVPQSQFHVGSGTHMQPPYHFHQPQHFAPPPAGYPPAAAATGPVLGSSVVSVGEGGMNTIKSSKSVGDLMSEMKLEDDEGTSSPASAAQSNMVEQREVERAKKRLSSFTPPPSHGGARNAAEAAKGSEWIPWPDLDGPAVKATATTPSSAVDYENLSDESIKKCRGLADMGFQLTRVVKVCKVLGDDEQQMLNFCLLVDKLCEEIRGALGEDVEDAVLLHSVDEEQSRKHMMEFVKLADFGFPKRNIHDALIATKLDHAKTLEKLLAQ